MNRSDRGSVLIPTLIAALLGALLAVGASIAVVQVSSSANVTPVTNPVYDSR